jgi:hypothetical protein
MRYWTSIKIFNKDIVFARNSSYYLDIMEARKRCKDAKSFEELLLYRESDSDNNVNSGIIYAPYIVQFKTVVVI